jgi:hypothetical protein
VSSYLPAAVSASLHLLPGRLRRWWLSGPPTLMSALGRAALADGWLPEFVRLGELERHLGEGMIESAVSAACAA